MVTVKKLHFMSWTPGQLYLMLNSYFELHNEFENLPIKSKNAVSITNKCTRTILIRYSYQG
jgi:hypothetical protein